MIKVSVMYPNAPSARFDHDYYVMKHMPMVKERMGAHCKSISIEKGLSGGTPGSAAPYSAIANMLCDSVAEFQAGFGPHAQEILGDIPNYSDQQPVIQMSEVVEF